MNKYIVATVKDWNINVFRNSISKLPGSWTLITGPEELTKEIVEKISPDYIFFPHWSWIVPQEIYDNYDCVCFHMTDVPFGRGGSPLQNLISRGFKNTKLTALKMVGELDAGPVYTKVELSLLGRAQDIFEDAAQKIFNIIKYITEVKPTPIGQKGDVTTFARRSPKESEIPKGLKSLEAVYDHIRMLDADTYPKAFIKHGSFTVEFVDATIHEKSLEARVIIKEDNCE